jgi:TonB family protein
MTYTLMILLLLTTCEGSIYKSPREVTKKAVLKSELVVDVPGRARDRRVLGCVVLRAVFCHTGKVTEVEVLESLPHGLTEATVKAVRKLKFAPAERDGVKVSQWIQIEYCFDIQ